MQEYWTRAHPTPTPAAPAASSAPTATGSTASIPTARPLRRAPPATRPPNSFAAHRQQLDKDVPSSGGWRAELRFYLQEAAKGTTEDMDLILWWQVSAV